MLVKWIRDHQLGYGKLAVVGEIADLPPMEAERKIQMNFAVAADDADEVTHVDPEVRSSDPTVRTRGKREA